MTIFIGTSGFAYKEWTGSFYPPGLKDGLAMLRHYASHFQTVEVNNTFYQLPSEETLLRWKETAGPGFRFAVKARRTITYRRDFAVPGGYFALFLSRIASLGDSLGPVLFQFPPSMKDPGRIAEFIEAFHAVGNGSPVRAIVEVRSPGLWNPDTFSLLHSRGIDLCLSDQFFDPSTWAEPSRTAYLRMRKAPYSPAFLRDLAHRLRTWDTRVLDCYVFLKHETGAPGEAKRLVDML